MAPGSKRAVASSPCRRIAMLLGIALGLSSSCARSHGSLPTPEAVVVAPPGGSTAMITDPAGARIDDFLTRMSGFGYSGNILVLRHGAIVLEKGYGEANRLHHTPYDASTVFDIGSLAKQFTAAAILKLETMERLAVGDSIGKFLDVAPADKRGITLHQLLTHTAGITVDFPYTDPSIQYEDVGRDEALRRIFALPLDYAPGTDHAYSNCGYIVLAAIVEKASGEPFRQYMHRSVFEPAGLRHTGFWAEPGLEPAQVAIGYNGYGEPEHDPSRRSAGTWQDLGGGQVVSTLADLERWRQELVSGRFLPASVLARMWASHTPGLSSRDGDYGYGWFIQRTPRQTTLIHHGGDYLGTGAQFAWFRDEEVVMITSTNVRHDLFPTRNRTDRVIPKILFGGEHPEPPAWVRDTTLTHAALGTYRLPGVGGGSLTVHERGGRFFIGASGQDATDLLMPAAPALRARRATTTAKAQQAMDGVCAGDLDAFQELAGGAGANPDFVAAVVKEIATLGQGPLRAARVLGTFATGYPRGNPLDYETTLVRLEFGSGHALYAIRWGNASIAYTDVPRFELAADTPVQPNGKGDLVTWNIVFSLGVTITPRAGATGIDALIVHAPDGDVLATRE